VVYAVFYVGERERGRVRVRNGLDVVFPTAKKRRPSDDREVYRRKWTTRLSLSQDEHSSTPCEMEKEMWDLSETHQQSSKDTRNIININCRLCRTQYTVMAVYPHTHTHMVMRVTTRIIHTPSTDTKPTATLHRRLRLLPARADHLPLRRRPPPALPSSPSRGAL